MSPIKISRKNSGYANVALAMRLFALASAGLSLTAHAADPVVFSFATVGDSRQDPSSPDPTTLLPNNTGALLLQDKQFLQNSKAFARMLRSVQSQKVNLFIENGDLIMGYGRASVPSVVPSSATVAVNSDLVKFYTQYAFWRGMVANTFETGTYTLPVPGNHETQCNSAVSTNGQAAYLAPTCSSGKHGYAENEVAYRANVGDLINDLSVNQRFQTVTGVAPQSPNGLTTATAPVASANNGPITSDQSQMSYSFDINTSIGLLHFTIINTDPAGADATAPSDWLAADLAAAQGRGAVKFFVFGHKPAFTYNYAAASGGTVAAAGLDANANIALRNAFWSVITQYGATYFCGHEHVFNIAQYADPLNVYAGTPYQVLVGSGGSPFDDKLVGTCPACSEPVFTNPTDRYYVWATVQVHQSGRVSLKAFGFNDGFGPTQLVQTINNLQ